MTKAEKILQMCSHIQYGMYDYVHKKNITPADEEWDIDGYLDRYCCVQTPEDTLKRGIGTCWDTSLLTHVLLRTNGYHHVNTLFMYADKERFITHSTTIYKEPTIGDWYWIELSWDGHTGISTGRYHVDNLINYIRNEFVKENGECRYLNKNLNVDALLKSTNVITLRDYLKIAMNRKDRNYYLPVFA